ncbi:RNA ligase family protein [Taibaiella koreensis]|uniref:RNA ligase family protein n=1 Tax=Taibaiella koreensis TaxID=1268548 RepID=UPI000E59C35A|nr:RNA ligase family protein [Taibaiella koreensis]
MDARKYGRTGHFPFSPGTTSDDRIQYQYWSHIQKMEALIHTEKLDGENNCLNRYGVFARSHAAPTTSPWTSRLRQQWALMKNDLGDLELFGENLYAIHSIAYRKLEQYYYVFAVRSLDRWLSWEEVVFYAGAFDLPVVPVLDIIGAPGKQHEADFSETVLRLSQENSVFDAVDPATGKSCTREGIVTRNTAGFDVNALGENVFKYVRKGHVQTDVHWTRNWRRAPLHYEYKKETL